MEISHVKRVGRVAVAFIALTSLASLSAIARREVGTGEDGQVPVSGASYKYNYEKGGGKSSRNSGGEADQSFSGQSKTKLFVSVNDEPRYVTRTSGGSDSSKRDPSTASLGGNSNSQADRGGGLTGDNNYMNSAHRKAKEEKKGEGNAGDIMEAHPPSPPPSLVLPLVAPAIARAAAAISTVLAIQTTLPEYELETALESYLETLHIQTVEQERGPARDPAQHSMSIAELAEESVRDESRSIGELHSKKKRIVTFGCVDIARFESVRSEDKEGGVGEEEEKRNGRAKGQDRLLSNDDEKSVVIVDVDAATTRKSPLLYVAGHVVEMHVIASQVIKKRLEEGAGLEPSRSIAGGGRAVLSSNEDVADGAKSGAAPPHANPPSDAASALAHVHGNSRSSVAGSGTPAVSPSPSYVTVRSCNIGFASSDDASEVLSQVAAVQSRIVGGIDDNERNENDSATAGGEERGKDKTREMDEALPQLTHQEQDRKRDKDHTSSSSKHRSENNNHHHNHAQAQGGGSLVVGKNRVVVGREFGLPDSIFGASVVCQREPNAAKSSQAAINFNFAGKDRWATADDSDDDDDDEEDKNGHGHLDASHNAGPNMCGASIEEGTSMYSRRGSEGNQERKDIPKRPLRPFQSSEPAEEHNEQVDSERSDRTGVQWSLTNVATPRHASAMSPSTFGVVVGLLLGCALGLL